MPRSSRTRPTYSDSPGARDMPPRDRLAYLIREGAVLGLLLYAIAAALLA